MSYIFNCYFIKSTNGLYYYGIDTVDNLSLLPSTILIRPELFESTSRLFPKTRIVPCNFATFIYEVFIAWKSNLYIYTPSSHPLPFINKQIIVLHDTYPFVSHNGPIKRWLFLISAKTSKCLLAYINHADTLGFYLKNKFDLSRLIFIPNKFSGKITTYQLNRDPREKRLIIGLVGTDSPKKNYHALFADIRRLGYVNSALFCIYGHSNGYTNELLRSFPEFDIGVIESNDFSVPDFLASIDVVLSVAQNEGFGRPIASALESGVPCYLIESPIFREFFDGGARFASDIPEMVSGVFEAWKLKKLQSPEFKPRDDLLSAFKLAIIKIENLLSNKN